MTLYITYGSYASVFLEINIRLGALPALKKETYKNETIIHLPYIQAIYTPATKQTRNQSQANGRRTKALLKNSKRTSEY